jgi:hypothetical protein
MKSRTIELLFSTILTCSAAERFTIWCEAKCFYDEDKSIGVVINKKCHCAHEVDMKEVSFKLKGLSGKSETSRRITYDIVF